MIQLEQFLEWLLNACKSDNFSAGLRFHDLRHTAATRMVESGASIVAVSRILGHADLKTTMRYAHPENTLKDAVEKLANFTQANNNEDKIQTK